MRIILDTETTGLHWWGEDEILTVSIIDDEGNVLWDKVYKPARMNEWPEAQAIHGISPEDVKDCPYITEDAVEISKLLKQADSIAGYNVGFDLSFLEAAGIELPDVESVDVMTMFAPVFGMRDELHDDWKWQKLSVAAAYVDYEWGEEHAHSSVADCRATLAVLKWLEEHEGEEVDRREQGRRRAHAWANI